MSVLPSRSLKMNSVWYSTRTVGPALGRVDEDATGPVDHSEDVFVVEELVARRPERHGPDPTDAKIALRLDDPALSL